MATFNAGPGITVHVPDDIAVRSSTGPAVRLRRGAAPAPLEIEALRHGLAAADLNVAAQIDLVPRQTGARALRRAGGIAPTIEVTVGASESAIVLVEGPGGVYGWTYAEAGPSAPPGKRARGERTLVFTLVPGAAPAARGRAAAPRRRGVVLDWIAEKLVGEIRAYVLKFVVKNVIDLGVDYIEGDQPTGLVSLAGDDPGQWRPDGAAMPVLAKDRAANVLLMVHGTFSSTAGSFGALTAQEDGRAFLSAARKRYDAIIGFDHKTLGQTPEENAAALMAAIETLELPQQSRIDAVAFSRGGLVYRVLAEDLLAKQRPDIKLGKAIFVGATNSGTHLAEPANWAATVDLYTNLLVAGARVLTGLAGGEALKPAVSFAIKTVGRFVQMLSEVAITEDRVPGLAAMEPESASVKALNQRQSDLGRLASYFAVTSNFVPKFELRNGITHELAEFLVDRVTNRLFQVDNDLVVDTASMTECGTRDPRFSLGKIFAFGDTEEVYHTIYFANARVAALLREWLNEEAATAQTGPAAPVEVDKGPLAHGEPSVRAPGRGRRRPPGGEAPARHVPAETIELPDAAGEPDLGAIFKYQVPMPAPGGRRKLSHAGIDAEPGWSSEGLGRTKWHEREWQGDWRTRRERADEGTAAGEDRFPPAAEPSATVDCHFAAEMEPSPPLSRPVPLFVTISREKVEVEEGVTSKATAEPVAVERASRIEVEVIARKNARVIGKAVRDILVPEREPETLRFEVIGIDPGIADILVEARQGPHMLVSFALAPVFVPGEEKLKRSVSGSTMAGPGAEPAVLRIYEIYESSTRLTLRFDLACLDPNIAVSESRALPPGFSRDLYVSDVLNDIEAAWATSARVYDQFMLRLKARGIEMANAFLPEAVRQALWRHRNEIRAIQVISEEPLIPWELLYVTDPETGPQGKGFLSEWGLVRWLHNAKWPSRRLALSPERVRYVIPDYVNPDLKLNGAAAERAMLLRQFAGAQEIKSESTAVAAFLYDGATDCDLLHFACHGEAAQKAVLNADLLMAGTSTKDRIVDDPLTAEVVKDHARFASEPPNPIVFINACQTGRTGAGLGGVGGFADAFLRPLSKRGAGAFIGALWSVDDQLAFGFAETFYTALKAGQTLVEAAQAARNLAKTNQEFTWLAYTVYGNPFARVAP